MNKNIFYNNKIMNFKKLVYGFLFFLLMILLVYLMNTNQTYFVISENKSIFYIVPVDKEGEKVPYTNKKSLNDFSENLNKDRLTNIDDLKYSIQLYSDIKYTKVLEYYNKLINIKEKVLLEEDIYFFSIKSANSTDYFLSYKNFESKNLATEECKLIVFMVDKCIIIKP